MDTDTPDQTLDRLAKLLTPIAQRGCAADDIRLVQVGIVLSCLAGCIIEPMTAEDLAALEHLARLAGTLCEHRLGQHTGTSAAC